MEYPAEWFGSQGEFEGLFFMIRFFRNLTLLLCLASGPALVVWVLSTEITALLWLVLAGAVLWPSLLMLWFLAFGRSQFPTRLKRTGLFFGVVIALGCVGALLLRYDGSASGASLPKFTWRWTEKVAEVVPANELSPVVWSKNKAPISAAADSAQFLGPTRDGVWPKLNFSPDWKSHPPKEIWRRPMGLGWSGFSVVGSRAVTQEQFGEVECVICYDLFTGRQLWVHRDDDTGYFYAGKKHKVAAMGGAGPRSTPTIYKGKIYTQGAAGIVNCLDLESGRVIWTGNPVSDHRGKLPVWGQSTAPLVIEEPGVVVVSCSEKPGATLVALDLESGEPVWTYAGRGASYSSPRLLTIFGKRQIVSVNARDLSGVDPASGGELWHYDWPGSNPKVGQPVLINKSRILATASYGVGSPLIEIKRAGEKWTAIEKWKSIKMKTKFSSVVVRKGYAYGMDEGRLACIDLAKGDRVWKKQKFGFGQQLLIGGDYLLIQAEPGFVVIGKINPQGFFETGRIEALSSMTWNTPTLAGRLLLLRNDREAVCFLLPPKTD